MWECGSMEPEYYASQYRQYQSFCKNYSGNELYKIACGPNADDTDWTRRLLSHLNSTHASAISLHYYTVPTGDWSAKGAACVFDDELYYKTLKSTWFMKEILDKHIAVMNEFDPDNKIKLIVDEWGCWYDVEEGTNPGFLYQQNTMRDAMVAAINLHLFNHYCERICMANLAQVVNVLQSVVLTEGDRMVKTPTFYVFSLLKGHQDATLIESSLVATDVADKEGIPMLNHTVSRAKDGSYLLTVSNCSLSENEQLTVYGLKGNVLDAKILTGDVHDHNTFDNPDKVKPVEYTAYKETEEGFELSVPPVSVISIHIEA